MLLAAWQGRAYVEYSDGVYAGSARAVLHGAVPYHDFAAAQPPGVFYAGTLLLALGDSPDGLRRGLAVVDLILAALVLVAVWRLTGRRVSAVVAGLAALLTPWALREHAQLTPETFAAPLLLAAALVAAEERWSWGVGLLGAAAAMFKLAFLLPAAAIAAVAAAPATALSTLILATAAELATAWVGFGSAFWRGTVEAQTQTGLAPLHYAGGLWAQAAWNLAPLSLPAGLAIRLRRRVGADAGGTAGADPQATRLFRAVLVTAAASLVLLLTLLKRGSYLNAVVVVEPPLLILTACAITWLLERRTWATHPVLASLGAVALLLGAVEVGSLLVSPRDPGAFSRPRAATTPGWTLTDDQVRSQVAIIDRCPPDAAYPGAPYLAFAAGRRPPGNQPDQFIIAHASVDARFRTAAAVDRRRCP